MRDFIITQGVTIISAISVQQRAPSAERIPVFAAMYPAAIISTSMATCENTEKNIYFTLSANLINAAVPSGVLLYTPACSSTFAKT